MDIIGCIVLYNNKKEIVEEAIKSFLNSDLNLTLYLIDNSPNNYLSCLKNDERIIYIFNPSNPGFGAAHNIAILKSIEEKSKYHLVLNPDIYFEKGEIEKMFYFLEDNKDFGQLMPKILSPDNSIQYLCKKNPTFFDLFARRFLPKSIQAFYKKRMDSYQYKNYDYDNIIYDVPYFSGCFMLFRTSSLEKIKGFDEKIFMYIEDADITRRMLQEFRTIYFPKAQVYHHYEKGSYKSFRLMIYNIQGAIIYFNKWGWF
ncbi:glycosyltransferase [Chryseobacterium aquaticum]|uniref:Glycosyl transferase family 2 n=1 Tax=Chryseobacterium aquaticum subsp. greenlandense TaxID=345663 RepID=A0A124F3K7_9FLAO|nr:glycosyltransferase [Chryseobacterium aquaticum]KUJ58274.1 glycosyl transferase family 2 [Chryseobacterium aquaticum subsp. greenlandense]